LRVSPGPVSPGRCALAGAFAHGPGRAVQVQFELRQWSVVSLRGF